MNKLKIKFNELKTLFDMPRDTWIMYDEIKSRISIDKNNKDGIESLLIICPTRKRASEELQHELTHVKAPVIYKTDKNTIQSPSGYTTHCFVSIEDVLFSNFLRGRSFTNVIFRD